jgi:hypothetical protein
MNGIDFRVENHGSIFLFDPQNSAAEEHLRVSVDHKALWFGGALVVEHRYARCLAAALQSEGFRLA